MPSAGRGVIRSRCGRIVGGVHGESGVAAVRQTDDDIRPGALPNADDGQLLSAQWVMGMGNGHESQRNLG